MKIYIADTQYDFKKLKNVKIWVYLNDSYSDYLKIKRKAGPHTELFTLSCRFQKYYEKLRGPLLNALRQISKDMPKIVWWSGQVASHTSTGSNVMRNCVYVRYVQDVISRSNKDLLIICSDPDLRHTIKQYGLKNSISVCDKTGFLKNMAARITLIGKLIYRVFFFLIEFQLVKRKIHRLRFQPKKGDKNYYIRSWITEGSITSEKKYFDRNFGDLSNYLEKKGFNVVFLPMFFNLSGLITHQLREMNRQNVSFLLPQHLLSFKDCMKLVYIELSRLNTRFTKVVVDNMDITHILRHEIKRTAFSKDLLHLNLQYPLLEKLKSKGHRIDRILYPFENNAWEKVLILAKREFFPESSIYGFQHSVVNFGQLGLEFDEKESVTHPLPDRIICSGESPKVILSQNNLPDQLMAKGPSLRFNHIRDYSAKTVRRYRKDRLNFVIALPYSEELSLEIIDKVGKSVAGYDCKVSVKPHPMLKRLRLENHLAELALANFHLVDIPCKELFKEGDVAFGITSVTQLEAIACGIPLVRIVPELRVFLDPVKWLNYPIGISKSIEQVKRNIDQALLLNDDTLSKLSEIVRFGYFSQSTDGLKEVFIGE